EIELGANDKIIQVFHFTKEPLRTHRIPFKFVIKAVADKYHYPHSIDVILSDYGLTDELLGLDHVDKTGHMGRVEG
ncbi:16191_t:CDS:2, partial [Cetraspora pellucida]